MNPHAGEWRGHISTCVLKTSARSRKPASRVSGMPRFVFGCLLLLTGLLGCNGEKTPPPAVNSPPVPVTPELKPPAMAVPASPEVEPSPAKAPPDYFPLQSPMTLKYTIAYEAFLIGKGTGTAAVVVGAQDVDGVQYTTQTTTTKGTPWDFTRTALFRRTEEGVVTRDLKATADRIFLPFPWEVGTKWVMKSGDGVVDCEVTAIEDVLCEATTYAGCLKVESAPQAGSTETRWFSPETGLVKTEVRGPRYKSTTVLTEVLQSVE